VNNAHASFLPADLLFDFDLVNMSKMQCTYAGCQLCDQPIYFVVSNNDLLAIQNGYSLQIASSSFMHAHLALP